ncbi:MAG: Non-ribosomal peptide synthetase, partial [uncultured Sulfurovum sp.]
MSNTLQVYRESNGITGITFITPKEEFLSYRDLATNALKFLTYFNKAGLKKDSKLIFQLSYNKNFVHTFWACVAGGIVAVPVTTGNNDEHRQKLFNIYTLLDDAYLIIDSDFLDKLESFAQRNNLMDIFSEIKSKTIDIRSIELETLALGVSIETNQDDLALIQFSSGSTGEPKGVMISANKIIQNGKGVLETSRISKKDSYLSWFPLTHDMGLMGWHINPILLGVNQVLIETNAFIRRPLLWLDCVTKYKSTVLCSPNFGYRYLLKFLKKKQNWDLSSIRLIYNGAEPISVSLCDEFMQTLAPYGLQATTMYPVYGLAEATLGVTVPKVSEFFKRYHLDIKYLSIGEKVRELETDLEAVTYVSVGSPLVNMEIRITHNNQVLDEDFIGHIEIKSVSVTEGYYNNIEVTNSVIKENGWLDTGDLGFMRDGELILTGRAKDIIIKNGINYYPHDIESICCNVEECELNKVVVIGVRSLNQEDEALVVFVLFKKEMKDFIKIEQEIKKVILRKVGLEIFQVIPVKTIYKTTSGKLQRYKFLSKYNNGEFNEVLKELETFDMQEEIFNPLLEHEQILSVLTKEINALLEGDIRIDKPLFEQGLTSITLIVFKEKVSKILKLDIPTMALFDYPTIKDLSDYLFRQSFNTLVPEIRNRRTIEKNTLEATSFQKRLFILSQFQDSANLYNLSLAWKTTQLDINKCQSIFSELLQVHQSLNLNLYIEEGQVYQKINTHEFLIDTQKISSEDVEDIIVEYIQRPFDLEHDLLFKVLILHHNSDDYLILKTHHTIFDGTSANILMRDFKKLYQNEDIVLPHKNYFDFTLDYKERLNLSLIKKQELFWLDKFKTVPSLLTLPTDNMYPSTRTYKGDKVYFKIDQALTKEIKQVAKEYNISINMLLYASFIILLNKITSQEDITVGIPVTTRADTFHNTVGMFINTLAMRQEINNALSIEAYFKQVKKLFLSTLDNIEYPLEDLVEKLKIKKDLARNMLFDVMFAYEDGAERVMDAFNFQKHEIKDKHSDFDLTLEILDESDSLHCSFQYYTEIFKATTIKRFISYYLKILTEIQENKLLKDIDMIPLEEKHLLESFNKTEKVYPKDKTLIELFEEQVAKTPNNIAVVYEE